MFKGGVGSCYFFPYVLGFTRAFFCARVFTAACRRYQTHFYQNSGFSLNSGFLSACGEDGPSRSSTRSWFSASTAACLWPSAKATRVVRAHPALGQRVGGEGGHVERAHPVVDGAEEGVAAVAPNSGAGTRAVSSKVQEAPENGGVFFLRRYLRL